MELLENEQVKIVLKHAKWLREASETAGGKLTKDDIMSILGEAPTKRRLRNISLPDDVSDRLAGYNVGSEKVIGDIISLYLDMLERGEVTDVFSEDNDLD
jgi:hypothetical protein